MDPVGIGVDLVDVRRFAAALGRTPRLLERVFTAEEILQCGGSRPRVKSLAARWAAKEAVAKVLVNTSGLSWHECQVLTDDLGQPRIEVRGAVHEAAARRGISRWLVSLSHDGHMAIAFVVAGTANS